VILISWSFFVNVFILQVESQTCNAETRARADLVNAKNELKKGQVVLGMSKSDQK